MTAISNLHRSALSLVGALFFTALLVGAAAPHVAIA